MRPGDRLICAFTEPLPEGLRFKEWPLHITIIPWLRISELSAALAKELEAKFSRLRPFVIIMGEEAKFGYKKQKTVNLVRLPSVLQDIERMARLLLHEKQAWIVDEADRTRKEYKPHVTAQSSSRLWPGDKITCDRLYIVAQQGNFKVIDKEVAIGNEQAKA